jgi:hypothetical protein
MARVTSETPAVPLALPAGRVTSGAVRLGRPNTNVRRAPGPRPTPGVRPTWHSMPIWGSPESRPAASAGGPGGPASETSPAGANGSVAATIRVATETTKLPRRYPPPANAGRTSNAGKAVNAGSGTGPDEKGGNAKSRAAGRNGRSD